VDRKPNEKLFVFDWRMGSLSVPFENDLGFKVMLKVWRHEQGESFEDQRGI
jgi:hypothetical protein